MNRSFVLCEGFLDRAFWAGWLLRLGCTEPEPAERLAPPDGTKPGPGRFWFSNRSGSIVYLVPCRGKDNVILEARRRLKEREVEAFARLVVCVDADTPGDPGGQVKTGLRIEDLERIVREHDPGAKRENDGEITLSDGNRVAIVRWEVRDQLTDGLPEKQCLERLVCAAVIAAYPERGPAVHAWLADRPKPPEHSTAKEQAWSYMAGWYAERGCEGFYRAVWEEARIEAELRLRLEDCGAWRVAEALAGAPVPPPARSG